MTRLVHLTVLVTILLSMAPLSQAQAADASTTPITTQMLDASNPLEHGDQVLVGTLQGLANRDAARLFLRTHFSTNSASDDFWMKYLTQDKHFKFEELPNLNAAIKHFKQQGIIKGVVVYDEKNANASYAAAMLASQRGDLLPVTNRILAYQSELLNGSTNWTQDPMEKMLWGTFFAIPQSTPQGLVITSKPGKSPHCLQRRIDLDLERLKAVEVNVTKVSHQWGLRINSGDMAVWLIPPTDRTGTIRVDLQPALWRSGRRAAVELCVVGDEATANFTVRSLRFLGPDGETAKPLAGDKPDCFKDLPIVEDLRGKFTDETAAATWSLENQLSKSNKQMAFSASPGWWNFVSFDVAVSRKAYLFFEQLHGMGPTKPMVVNDRVFAYLDRPAAILGWSEPEWVWNFRVSQAGHRIICAGAPNLSFWQHVPVDAPVRFKNPRLLSGPLTEKYHVIFCNGDGDAPKTIAGLMKPEIDFASSSRGRVPVAYTIPPFLDAVAPALLEFYANKATPNDGFYCGASGLGYAAPSVMPNAEAFCAGSGQAMRKLNLPALDLWDFTRVRPGDLHALYNPAGQEGNVPMYIHSPATDGCPSDNRWLDDGTPVLMGRYGGKDGTGMWAMTPRWFNRNDVAGDLLQRVLKEADRHEAPYFIIVYGHFSYEVFASVAERLPKDKFEVLTIGDATALAREAGALTATPRGSGLGAGQSIDVDLALRNPDGSTGAAGTVTWTLPAGWTSDVKEWRHGAIAPRTTIRQTVTLIAPKEWNQPDAVVTFRSDHLTWKRTIRLKRYIQSTTVADFTASNASESWAASDGATLKVLPNGVAHLTGTRRTSKLTKRVTVDFDQHPVFEIAVPRTEVKWALAIAQGKQETILINEKAFTGVLRVDVLEEIGSGVWTGKQEIELRLYPAWSLGEAMDVKWIKLHQRLP